MAISSVWGKVVIPGVLGLCTVLNFAYTGYVNSRSERTRSQVAALELRLGKAHFILKCLVDSSKELSSGGKGSVLKYIALYELASTMEDLCDGRDVALHAEHQRLMSTVIGIGVRMENEEVWRFLQDKMDVDKRWYTSEVKVEVANSAEKQVLKAQEVGKTVPIQKAVLKELSVPAEVSSDGWLYVGVVKGETILKKTFTFEEDLDVSRIDFGREDFTLHFDAYLRKTPPDGSGKGRVLGDELYILKSGSVVKLLELKIDTLEDGKQVSWGKVKVVKSVK